jgi:hypothetical protein
LPASESGFVSRPPVFERTRRRSAAPAAIERSLARLAERIERETPTDADAEKRAANIRAVARGLKAPDAPTRDRAQEQGRKVEAIKRDPVALYQELEDQLRRRDTARGKLKARGDGGLER